MVGDTQIWQDEYPHTLRYRDTTLHLQGPIAPHTRQAFEELIAQSANAKRVSAPLACVQSQLFTKREKLDSLKKKLRMQRGRPKRNVTAPLTQHSNRLANPGCCAPDFLLAPIRHDATSMQKSKISSPNRRLLKIHRRPTCSGQVGHQSRGI